MQFFRSQRLPIIFVLSLFLPAVLPSAAPVAHADTSIAKPLPPGAPPPFPPGGVPWPPRPDHPVNPGPTPPPVTPPPAYGRTCFYSGSNFTGSAFCIESGQFAPDFGAWRNSIVSIQVFNSRPTTICTEANMSGRCIQFTFSVSDVSVFGGEWQYQIGSARVD